MKGIRSLLGGGIGPENSCQVLAQRLDGFLQTSLLDRPVMAVEIGCGDGRGSEILYRCLTHWYSPAAIHFHALDMDLERLRQARRFFDESPGVRLLQSNLYTLPLSAESVDFLFALNVFHWAARPSLLKEARRVLRNDGKIFFYDVLPVRSSRPRPLISFTLSRQQLPDL